MLPLELELPAPLLEPELLEPELLELELLLEPELLELELPVLLLEPGLPPEPDSPPLELVPDPAPPPAPEPLLAPEVSMDPELPVDPELIDPDAPTPDEELDLSPLDAQSGDAAIATAIARVVRNRMGHPLLADHRGQGARERNQELSPRATDRGLCYSYSRPPVWLTEPCQ